MVWQEIVFAIVIFVTVFLQAVTGFSGAVLAVPPALRLVGGNVALPVLNVLSIAVSIYLVVCYFKSIQWKEFLILVLCIGAGFGGGFAFELLPINHDILIKVYGAVLAIIAIIYFFAPLEKIKIPFWVLCVLLVIGGLMHKLFLSAGPLVLIYALKRFQDKSQTKGTLAAVWIVLNSILLGQQIGQGLFNAHLWLIIAVGLGAAILALTLSHFVAKKLPRSIMSKVAYVLLFVAGISLII